MGARKSPPRRSTKRGGQQGVHSESLGTKANGRVAYDVSGVRDPAPGVEGAQYRHTCPQCGDCLKVRYTTNRYGQLGWLVFCEHRECEANDLATLARLVGAPSGIALKDDPLRWLEAGADQPEDGRAE